MRNKNGKMLNKPVVATTDAHYLRTEDYEKRNEIRCQAGFYREDLVPRQFETTEEMLNDFAFLPQEVAYEIVVENSNLISNLCAIKKNT